MPRAAVLAGQASGPAEAGAVILARIRGALDQHLDPRGRAPLAVGFSGGGDSLALLLAARAWAAEARRPLLVLTVDHGLQAASGEWTRRAGQLADSLGCAFRPLAWSGPRPLAGVAAAARRARHALLAEAARAAGARVVLMGHTLDDLIEADRMRREGSSVGSPRVWAPSPAWPEGRGVFLLRPLLGLRRAELRALLSPAGLSWIEDPANDDPASPRARARRLAAADPPPASVSPPELPVARADEAGILRLDRARLMAASPPDRRRLLAMACVSAGGGERLPRSRSLDLLLAGIEAAAPFAATLAGARIDAGEQILIGRDPGRLPPGGGQAPEPGAVSIWDGRYELALSELALSEPGWTVRPLRGLAGHLPPDQRSALRRIPPFARGALPVLMRHGNKSPVCPILAEEPPIRARCLVDARFAAACGRIAREEQLLTGSDGEDRLGALS